MFNEIAKYMDAHGSLTCLWLSKDHQACYSSALCRRGGMNLDDESVAKNYSARLQVCHALVMQKSETR